MTCPNCACAYDNDVEMESNARGVRAHSNLTHTCSTCGYTESRV